MRFFNIEWTNENLQRLGRATAEMSRRDTGDQDYRGWNRALGQILANYTDMERDERTD